MLATRRIARSSSIGASLATVRLGYSRVLVSCFLVTGAAGFIGSHLAEALAGAGHDVLGVDAFTEYYDPGLKRANVAGLEVIEDDLETADLAALLDGVDGVFHFAGQPGVRASFGAGFEVYVRRNVIASGRLFEAAARRGTRVVYASSSSVYGDAESYPTREDAVPAPISPYGVTKLCCEQLAYAHGRVGGLEAVGLRFFTVYGPRQRPDMAFTRLLEALADGRPFPLYGDGSASRSFTFVADAVAGAVLAMERGGRGAIYNIGGGEEASLLDAIALAEGIAGRPLVLERHAAAAGDVRRTRADWARARDALGWAPSTALADGLAVQWQWVAGRFAAR
jgi:nucleoside-diphosphate-sugar epimerase